MSLRRHASYSETGVVWLGPIPSHWRTMPIKRAVKLRSGDTIGPEAIEPDGPYPVYGGNGLRGFTSNFTHDGEFVLIGRQGALCGNVNYASGQFWASEHAVVATPALRPAPPMWLGELLRAMNLGQYSTSAAQPGLSVEVISNLIVPIPPPQERIEIAAFLDRETEKIDALVEEQRRLIELLKEKRQAVISHAVTKGLNPKAEMKHSGVEWLGEVPVHWDVRPLRYSLSSITSGTSVNAIDTPAGEGELGVLKTSCVYTGQFDPTENKAVLPEERGRVSCPVLLGSIIVSRMNTPDLVGAAGLVEEAIDGIYLPDRLWQVRVCEGSAAFFHFWMQSLGYRAQVRVACAGASSSMQNLGQDQFRGFMLAVPPAQEQGKIAEYLSDNLMNLDRLTGEANAAIELLQERRAALISAAVTGKIDVRDATTGQEEAA